MLEKAKTLVVQFSGGKDSTSAALWAAKHKGDRAFQLVFTDPGVEFPGISAQEQRNRAKQEKRAEQPAAQ